VVSTKCGFLALFLVGFLKRIIERYKFGPGRLNLEPTTTLRNEEESV
jgi:hypothetical protein